MKTKHTKTPWIIDVSDRVLEANGYKAAIVGSNGEVICFIEKTLGMEEVANAKLIAAAPNLLEALFELKEIAENDDQADLEVKLAVIRIKANQAIKKATS